MRKGEMTISKESKTQWYPTTLELNLRTPMTNHRGKLSLATEALLHIAADVKVNKRSITMDLFVIEGPGPNLIGREAFDQIGIGLEWISRRLTTRMNRLHPKESEDNENGKEHFQNRFKSQENGYGRSKLIKPVEELKILGVTIKNHRVRSKLDFTPH
ncbi:hypothetical protein LAZ67_21000877, partial [Cordylochernes scorpioides]